MKIKHFADKDINHYSYAILSECELEIILIDPSNHINEYLDYAGENQAKIIGIIETTPFRDFIEAHLELHRITGATIYCSKFAKANYPHIDFDDNQTINFGKITLEALNTPGYTGDSICIVLDHKGKDVCVFTGETLLFGDCARPRFENKQAGFCELAAGLYDSLREKLLKLSNDVVVYPANGKNEDLWRRPGKDYWSTIEQEKKHNWALQNITKEQFLSILNSKKQFNLH